eukprot:TRINITY_DN204_c0_g1_i1.p1 TRINITY_DN204_c0_g1~~TRINITY_DN204_c0_g1_i1.p1  ORF type:complete len:183 (+),score=22.97 TRINITY_DN204_c0_g1_i1:75-623(+)
MIANWAGSRQAWLLLIIHTLTAQTSEYVWLKIHYPPEVSYIFRTLPARDFGKPLSSVFHHVDMLHAEPDDACTDLTNGDELFGKVALIARGTCSFAEKAYRAQEAGALTAIVYDNDPSNDQHWIDMIVEGLDFIVEIPSLFMLGADGHHLKTALAQGHTIDLTLPINRSTMAISRQTPWTFW